MSNDHSDEGLQDLRNAASLLGVAVDVLYAFRRRTGHHANPADKGVAIDVSFALMQMQQTLIELADKSIRGPHR